MSPGGAVAGTTPCGSFPHREGMGHGRVRRRPPSGVLLYLLGFVVIPEERRGDPVRAARPGAAAGAGPAMVIGIGLVAIGAVTLVSRLVPSFSGLLGPAALIGIGVLVLLKGVRR